MDVNPKFPLVQFAFSAGIDEANRAEVVEAGSGWLVLENGRQDQRGGYSTRPGFSSLSTLRLDPGFTAPSAGYKLFADSRSPVRINDTFQVEAYSSQAASWRQLSRVCEADYRTTELQTFNGSTTPEDVEYCGGYVAVVGQTATYATLALYDATTFATVLPSAQFGVNTIRPQVASYGGRYIAMLSVTATTIEIYFCDVSTAATVFNGFTAGFSSITTTTYPNTSISMCSLGDRIAVAWINNLGGTSRITVRTYDITGQLDTVNINTSSVTPTAVDIACFGGTGTLWVAWNEAATLKMTGITYNSLATTLATTTTVMALLNPLPEIIGISPSSATAGRVCSNDGTSQSTMLHMRGFTIAAGATATVGTQQTAHNVSPCSRPNFYNGRHYVHAFGSGGDSPMATGNTQQNLFYVDWTDSVPFVRPVVAINPGLAINAKYGKAKTIASATATMLLGVGGARRSGQVTIPTLLEYDFASLRRWQSAAFGNTTFLSGGILTAFTGDRATEAAFLHRPKVLGTPSTSGVGTLNGNYRYVYAYEDVDADGNWVISGLSDPLLVTAANNSTITLTAAPLSITQRSSSNALTTTPKIAWYRTLVGGIPPYYRVGTSLNDNTTPSIIFADTTLDAVLSTKAKLYAQPGVLGTAQDRRAPPGLALVVAYNGMLVGATGSDVWYSAQNVQGEGAWFNPIFQVPVPGTGDITALAVLDGALIVFKRNDVYAITGEAPSDNAASGGLGLPRRLAADVGASSPNTCSTTVGVIFQSDRGIEILTRNQTVEWIGENVQVSANTWPVCTAMTVNPISNVVMIEMAAATAAGLVSGTGRTLIYDLSVRAWVSTDRRTTASSVIDAPAQSACMIPQGATTRYAWLAASGVVHVETPGASLDANASMVCKRAVSASVKGSGLLGAQYINRTQLLAKRLDPHDLTMSFAYDYSASFVDARTWTNAELSGVAVPSQQLEHPMGADADCEAVRVQLLDVTPSSGTLASGRAATWIGLCFEVVPKGGAYLLPDTSR